MSAFASVARQIHFIKIISSSSYIALLFGQGGVSDFAYLRKVTTFVVLVSFALSKILLRMRGGAVGSSLGS